MAASGLSIGGLTINNPLSSAGTQPANLGAQNYGQEAASAQNFAAANPNQALMETAGGKNVATTPTPGPPAPASGGLTTQQQQQLSATDQAISLDKQILAQEQANAPGTAANINLNALNAQASGTAANTVNPLYTQYLNQFLQEEAANQQAATAQNTMNIQGEQSSLGNTLAQNQLQENAAASTNALTQGNINAQQQNYQLQSGNAQNQKLQAIGQSIGSGNLGASGIGQQQIYQAENAKNTADAAQLGQFQYQRDTGNLSTQDTFAQLAQSSQYATTAEGQAEAQTNFNLNDYLRQAAYNDSQYQQTLEGSRQEALSAATWNTEAHLIQQQIQAQTGGSGKNFVASEQAYGNLMNLISQPTAPSQSQFVTSYGTTV